MNESRRKAQRKAGLATRQNLQTAAETLKQREAWKYVALKKALLKKGREFEFEYQIKNFIFDLALLDSKILIEFDGQDHKSKQQQSIDSKKRETAETAGFHVVHRNIQPMTIIDPSIITEIAGPPAALSRRTPWTTSNTC